MGVKRQVRFLGVFLDRNLTVHRSLLVFYGIGKARASQVLDRANVPPHELVSSLSYLQVARLRIVLARCVVEGSLRRLKAENLKRHLDIGSARGRRHWVGLPVRGQRTRTNA